MTKSTAALEKPKQELFRVNDLLLQLTFISSNDFQEPLRKIGIFSSLLPGSKTDLNEYAGEYSGKINNAAIRMSALVRNLLSFSVQIKRHQHEYSQIELTTVVVSVVNRFQGNH